MKYRKCKIVHDVPATSREIMIMTRIIPHNHMKMFFDSWGYLQDDNY